MPTLCYSISLQPAICAGPNCPTPYRSAFANDPNQLFVGHAAVTGVGGVHWWSRLPITVVFIVALTSQCHPYVTL